MHTHTQAHRYADTYASIYIYIKVYQSIYIYQSWFFSDTRLSNNLTNLANYKRSCNYLMTVTYNIIKYSGMWRDMILVNI